MNPEFGAVGQSCVPSFEKRSQSFLSFLARTQSCGDLRCLVARRALTNQTPFGRRMENGLPTTRMRPAKTNYMSGPRMAKAILSS